MMIICAIVLGVLVIAGVLFAVLRRPKKTANLQSLRQEAAEASGGSAEKPKSSAPRAIELDMPDPSAGRLVRLRARLARSNNMLGKGLLALLSRDRIDQDVWDEVEETLLLADLGSEPTTRLVEALQQRVRVEGTSNPAAVKKRLREELVKIVRPDMDRELKTAGSDGNPGVVLVVGGPWGTSRELGDRADASLSLSRMTFTHEMCFLFLAEQLYRAFSILAGTGYHH